MSKEMTKSQAKRAARKQAAAQAKREANRQKMIGYIIILAIVAFVGWIAYGVIMKQVNKVTASDDYSAGLEANGFISGTSGSDIMIPDYKTIVVPYSDIEYTDEDIEASINNTLSADKVLNTDPSREVVDGDTVNIDYVGTVDGVEFDGGSAQGYDLTIGSGSFIPGFEEQIIGMTITGEKDINVTFPEDYTEELAGKDAVFRVTVNGIQDLPEFTDEYVQANLSDKASTVDEYKAYLRKTNEDTKLTTWVQNYIETNSEVKSYKSKYLRIIKSYKKYDDEMNFEGTKQFYEMYGMEAPATLEESMGMTEEEYLESLDETAHAEYTANLAYQAVLENEGVTVDAEYYKDVLASRGGEDYDTLVEKYGEPYVMQMAIKEKATEIVKNMVTIE